mmetsp:Transcript_30886/g.96094  ORF Transcript_30886/g.96094 Transcript_30886/m.96094 type:complete len:575 (-) Transcript_30886:26-1750(-)
MANHKMIIEETQRASAAEKIDTVQKIESMKRTKTGVQRSSTTPGTSMTSLKSFRTKAVQAFSSSKTSPRGDKAAVEKFYAMQAARKLQRHTHGEPSQAYIRIRRITAAFLDSPKDGIRSEMVRLRMRDLAIIWTRSGPKDYFDTFQRSAADVVDFEENGFVDGNTPAKSSLSTVAGLKTPLGPTDDAQDHTHGWQTLEVAISFFAVVYCQAPLELPSLRKIVVRHRNEGARMAAGGRRAIVHKGGAMFRLRAVFHGKTPLMDDLPPPPHGGQAVGVVVTHLCALRVIQYQPLVDVIRAAVKLPPGRVWEDPLQLCDIRRRMKVERRERTADTSIVRTFEKLTGAEDLEGFTRRLGFSNTLHTGWRCFLVTGGARATAVRPLTAHFHLVQQLMVPSGRHVLQRQSFAPFFSAGSSFHEPAADEPRDPGALREYTDDSLPSLEHRRVPSLKNKILEGITSIKKTIDKPVLQPRRWFWCEAATSSSAADVELTTPIGQPSLQSPRQPSLQSPREREHADQGYEPASETGWGDSHTTTGEVHLALKVLTWEDTIEALEMRTAEMPLPVLEAGAPLEHI